MITTKTGDNGWTGYGGKKVRKDNPIIEAIGILDELQAVLSIINYQLRITNFRKIIVDIQKIMSGKKTEVNLDVEIKRLEEKVKPVNKFIIFSNKKAIYLNWARTVTRRAERRAMALKDKKALEYLNRLSKFIYLKAIETEEK